MINILQKKKNLIIGINSGTSADGIDMAVVEIDRNKGKYNVKFITGTEKKFPQNIKNEILRIADNQKISIDDAIYVDNILGKYIADTLKKYMKSLAKKSIHIDAVASHGQTIRHLPKKIKKCGKMVNGTYQIGSPEFIAQSSGLPVVSDFRQADIAIGGEGAPITTGAMARLFADSKEHTLIVNIGGMSNFFFIPKTNSKENLVAEDCGPGNVLSDLLMRKLFNVQYDKNGKTAKKGTISKRLLTILSANSFQAVSEKSTGRELFGLSTVNTILKQAKKLKLSPEDILATTIEFTAFSIFQSVKKLIKSKKIQKLYLTGGGRKNIFLIERLQAYFDSCSIDMIERKNIDGDYVEAVAYALMGEATLFGESINAQQDKKVLPIYGKISLPPVLG